MTDSVKEVVYGHGIKLSFLMWRENPGLSWNYQIKIVCAGNKSKRNL